MNKPNPIIVLLITAFAFLVLIIINLHQAFWTWTADEKKVAPEKSSDIEKRIPETITFTDGVKITKYPTPNSYPNVIVVEFPDGRKFIK
jgi:hypothetical protein